MDAAKACQQIRQGLESGALPRDFDLTCFTVGCTPPKTNCKRCGEKLHFFSN